MDKGDKSPVLMSLSGGRTEKSRETGKNPEKPRERGQEGTVWSDPEAEMGQDLEREEVETHRDSETEQRTARQSRGEGGGQERKQAGSIPEAERGRAQQTLHGSRSPFPLNLPCARSVPVGDACPPSPSSQHPLRQDPSPQ